MFNWGEALLVVTQICLLVVCGLGIYEYVRLRRRADMFCQIVMAATDQLIDKLLQESAASSVSEPAQQIEKRDRLAAISAGGQRPPPPHFWGEPSQLKSTSCITGTRQDWER